MTSDDVRLIPLPPIGDDTSTGRVADDLALAIHLGRIAPGLPLREVELAATHDVSRTIVRAALQRLEAQGLVEITLNKGARVRQLDPAALADMLELHAELTALAARQAAQRATPEQLATLRRFVGLMEAMAEAGGSAEDFQHLRVGFGRALYEAAGPVMAERLHAAVPPTPHHARALADISRREGQAEAAALARNLLAAIEDRAADAAAQAAQRFIRTHADRSRMVTPRTI